MSTNPQIGRTAVTASTAAEMSFSDTGTAGDSHVALAGNASSRLPRPPSTRRVVTTSSTLRGPYFRPMAA